MRSPRVKQNLASLVGNAIHQAYSLADVSGLRRSAKQLSRVLPARNLASEADSRFRLLESSVYTGVAAPNFARTAPLASVITVVQGALGTRSVSLSTLRMAKRK